MANFWNASDSSVPWEAVEPALRQMEDTMRGARERMLGARRTVFPQRGALPEEINTKLDHLKSADPAEEKGRLTVFSLKGNPDVQAMAASAFMKFLPYNALFSPTLPSVSMMELDVMDMSVALLGGGEDAAANLTLGGSESIYCGLHAAREWARRVKPEIRDPEVIVPWSAHPAFIKGAHLLGLKLIATKLGDDHRADMSAIQSAITPNTIGLVGSAPCWPYGLYDDIPALGRLAIERDLWLHVDACVGGFLAPFVTLTGRPVPKFDLSVPGVRSLSADLHKYGYAAKPLSMILWADRSYQQFHYQISLGLSGMYGSHSLLGSRPAGAVASAWAVMNMLGIDGYVKLAQRTMAVKDQLVLGLNALKIYDVWDNELSILVFGSNKIDVSKINTLMKEKGWHTMGTAIPHLIQLTLDSVDDNIVTSYLKDISEATIAVLGGLEVDGTNLGYVS